MGRAARWLRSLWGGRSKEHREHSTCSGGEERTTAERKRWSFRKSRNSEEAATSSAAQNASTAAAIEAAWFRSFYAESEKEQSKHAIAVAAATAAAADAAVAAAEAAVAVVRLTSGGAAAAMFVGYQEQLQLAAVKVQTAFRAYLARKALRALKALVKLQALVRGYLVRKQAAATLHSMQALIRAQATVRAQRSRNLLLDDAIFLPEIQHRRSLGRIDDARSRRPSSHQTRRFSASIDSVIHSRNTDVDEIIDACRMKLRSSRRTSYSAMDSADDDASYHAFSSPLPSQIPARISIPSRRNFQENECCCINVAADKYRLPATAHSTPRCMNSSAGTPAKSLCVAEGVFRMCSSVSNSPNYMANTQSYKAKLRSSQATTTIKRQPLGEINLGGIGIMQKSFSQVEEAFNFKRAVVEKLDRSSDAQKEAYLQRMW